MYLVFSAEDLAKKTQGLAHHIRFFPWASILLHGPLDICLDLLPAAPLPRAKTGRTTQVLHHKGAHAETRIAKLDFPKSTFDFWGYETGLLCVVARIAKLDFPQSILQKLTSEANFCLFFPIRAIFFDFWRPSTQCRYPRGFGDGNPSTQKVQYP